jgi:hypothetical protein
MTPKPVILKPGSMPNMLMVVFMAGVRDTLRLLFWDVLFWKGQTFVGKDSHVVK